MSNILRSRFFESSDLIRKNRVEHYLGSLPATEHDGDSLVADDLHDSDKPLASTLALIPIAAHQESRWIAPTMAEYAKQQTDEPFSVCLFLNAPLDQTNASTVDETVTAVEVAKRQHPQLDIRSSLEFIDEPTIGLVRRRLWNAALMLAHYEGAYDNPTHEVVALNHDIDTMKMSPRYIHRVQNHFHTQQQKYNRHDMQNVVTSPAATLTKHGQHPDYPNIGKLTFWHDLAMRQLGDSGRYEAGTVIPLSLYAHEGGFKATSVTHETRSILKGKSVRGVRGTILETSPRRYIDRARNGLAEIWTAQSFGATNNCRTNKLPPDLSHDELENIIYNDLDFDLESIALRAFAAISIEETQLENEQEIVLAVEKFIRLSNRGMKLTDFALRRVIGSPVLADLAKIELRDKYEEVYP